MSIQWTFIAGYLYFEIAVVTIMMLPILSPRKWHQFFRSRLFAMFQVHASFYFFAFLGVLCLFLVDAIREMRKYSHISDGHVHLTSEMKGNVKMFRAQRNFYITGFAIFLSFVIRRLVTMLIIQDELSQKAEQIIKKAEDTVKHAKQTVLEANTRQSAGDADNSKIQLEIVTAQLGEEKLKVEKIQEEATKWRMMYQELLNAKKE